MDAERAEIARRVRAYLGGRPAVPLTDRTVVIVDDGLATGLTARAAAAAVARQRPRRVVVAVPIAPAPSVREFASLGIELEAVATPTPFEAVGRFYDSFPPVEDDEVRAIRPAGADAPAGTRANILRSLDLTRSMSEYLFQEIETRWQQRWARGPHLRGDGGPGPAEVLLPGDAALPVRATSTSGTCGTTASPTWSRATSGCAGFNVLHPIGWDALGLPAENAAIKRGVHPEKWTRDNIAGMKRQLQRLGFSYPWSREIATCDPEYYRWNQWFFLRMLERGHRLPQRRPPVNWCPSCQTVLANEQAEGGDVLALPQQVEERELDQWFLRITAYQDELLDDMAQLPELARRACS